MFSSQQATQVLVELIEVLQALSGLRQFLQSEAPADASPVPRGMIRSGRSITPGSAAVR
jgi:hypothetical protein